MIDLLFLQNQTLNKITKFSCRLLFFFTGEFIVSILPMIETDGMSKDDIGALVEKTQISMQEEFTRISSETLERQNSRVKAD